MLSDAAGAVGMETFPLRSKVAASGQFQDQDATAVHC